MSTSSQRARAAAAAAAAAGVAVDAYPEAGAVVNPGANRARRLAAAEAAAALPAQAARQAAAAAAAQEVAATAAALRAEMDWELRAHGWRSPDPYRGNPSRSPERHRRAQSPLPPRRRGRGGRHGSLAIQTVYKDGAAGTPWPQLTKSNYHE